MTDDAERCVANAREMIYDFENIPTEERYGAIKHAIAELENARGVLPDE